MALSLLALAACQREPRVSATVPHQAPAIPASSGAAASGHSPHGDRTGLPPQGPAPVDAIHGASAPAETIAGSVRLAPGVGSAPAQGVLFVIARSKKDRQIVAVRKEDVKAFPHEFELSAADAMSQGASFGGPVELTVRLSRSGDAAPAPGDIEGKLADVAPGSRGIVISLDRVLR
jgi:cytochrome c-type biogenesis protein CcmH